MDHKSIPERLRDTGADRDVGTPGTVGAGGVEAALDCGGGDTTNPIGDVEDRAATDIRGDVVGAGSQGERHDRTLDDETPGERWPRGLEDALS